jgi:hypothetical protein
MVKANALLAPLIVFGHHIFRYEHSVLAAPNQFVFRRIAFGSNKPKNRVAIRRRDPHPASSRFIALIQYEAKSKLVDVEVQTLVLIADEHIDAENAQVGILPVEADDFRW